MDPCMRTLIEALRLDGLVTLASCCGHGRYPPTAIVRDDDGNAREYFTGRIIPRRRRFYRRDAGGMYYVPEVVGTGGAVSMDLITSIVVGLPIVMAVVGLLMDLLLWTTYPIRGIRGHIMRFAYGLGMLTTEIMMLEEGHR